MALSMSALSWSGDRLTAAEYNATGLHAALDQETMSRSHSRNAIRVGIGVPEGLLPPLPLTPKRACLHGSGVPRVSPFKGQSPWDILPQSRLGSARSSLSSFIVLSCKPTSLNLSLLFVHAG